MGELHLDQLIEILDRLAESIDCLFTPPDVKQAETIIKSLAEVVQVSELRRKERVLRTQSPDYDEQEADAIADENEEDDSFLGSVCFHMTSCFYQCFTLLYVYLCVYMYMLGVARCIW